jgi:hypothetical protein
VWIDRTPDGGYILFVMFEPILKPKK